MRSGRGISMRKVFLLALLCVAFALGQAQAQPTAERGKYLVEVLGACGSCHTPKGPQGDIPEKHMAGGFKLNEAFGVAVSSNITPDKETGIGKWTDGQIIAAIYGIRPDGRQLLPPMPWPYYKGKISDGDLKAILAYLRSLKPIQNKVAAPLLTKKP